MSRRIVLYGASGYTGRLVAAALVQERARPVLAGRSHQNLAALGVILGKGLDIAVASPAAPESLLAIIEPGDVLVNTAGPFDRIGRPVVEAAIVKGAAYLDSSGEPQFIRAVHEDYAEHAATATVPVITAAAYEYAVGDVAATLALQPVQDRAVRVDVVYLVTGRRRGAFSKGTLASAGGALLRPHHAWRDGTMVAAKAADRTRVVSVQGRRRAGVSIGGAEHYWIPRRFPGVTNVNVYLALFKREAVARMTGRVVAMAAAAPGVPRALERLAAASRSGPGPSQDQREATGSMVSATAFDSGGGELHTVTLAGADPYSVTGPLMAWEALTLQREWPAQTGVRSPVEVFGLEPLQDALAHAGLPVVEER